MNQAIGVFDVATWEIRFVLNYLAAFLHQVCFCLRNALHSNFQDGSKRGTSLNKQTDVFPMEADHVCFLVRDLKAEFLDVEADGCDRIFGLNQNDCPKCIRPNTLRILWCRLTYR